MNASLCSEAAVVEPFHRDIVNELHSHVDGPEVADSSRSAPPLLTQSSESLAVESRLRTSRDLVDTMLPKSNELVGTKIRVSMNHVGESE